MIGIVEWIRRYPVKSLAGVELQEAQIDAGGIPGDRAQALIVREGHVRVDKTYRGKENNLLHTTATIDEAQSFAARTGVIVEPRSDESHYFDCAPISLILDHWINEASELVGYELEPLRFRPNLFARAAPEFQENESSLVSATLAIGSVVLRVRKPIERCVTPTYDLQTGLSDPKVLREITQHRGACLGIYCDVEVSGRVSRGDSIRLSVQRDGSARILDAVEKVAHKDAIPES
ncbi:MAG: MOSC domain-containing protein [Candidatus Eremiobacteraeota bacterium]|nr:MOSC domain-containing protein [Candidatus Eremiobacteraeota bacterium]